MKRSLVIAAATLSFGIAHAQQPEDPRPLVLQKLQKAPALAVQRAVAPAQQVVNLGDVVVNVVIAKVLGEGADAELTIAKFGGTEPESTSRVVTRMQAETRERKVVLNGETKVQEYTVQVPVTEVIHAAKENFTPTEKDRSVPTRTVKAFDLKGNPVKADEWIKRLATPKHVLLLREPINETNKLNPFYTSILREDTLLLFLQGEVIDDRITMIVYNVKDLPVWSKDEVALDPNTFIEMIKSRVTPQAWGEKSVIRPFEANQSLVIAATQKTHEALAVFFKEMRDQIAKQEKE
jgi:hypothetical protein